MDVVQKSATANARRTPVTKCGIEYLLGFRQQSNTVDDVGAGNRSLEHIVVDIEHDADTTGADSAHESGEVGLQHYSEQDDACGREDLGLPYSPCRRAARQGRSNLPDGGLCRAASPGRLRLPYQDSRK